MGEAYVVLGFILGSGLGEMGPIGGLATFGCFLGGLLLGVALILATAILLDDPY